MSKAVRDALIVAAAAIVAYVAALSLDLYESLHDFLTAHENWQADELMMGLIVLGLATFGYAMLRLRDLAREVKVRIAAEAHAEHIAFHDRITGLPNRHFVERRLAGVIAADEGYSTAFLIDVNNFKRVNDLVGNQGGDTFLETLARRLGEAVPGAFIARTGGDEFLVVAAIPEAEVDEVAARLSEACRQPQIIGGQTLRTCAAIGFATLRGAGMAAVHQADLAMQEAKQEVRRTGQASVCRYDPKLARRLAERLLIETDLREAIAEDRLVPHFQPLVQLGNGTVHGFEALARWPRADGSFVPPDVFIPIAENAGLIGELSDKLLRRACVAARDWPDTLILTFNISPRQLSDAALADRILRILKEAGFPPRRLSLEITESAVIGDVGGTLRLLDQLRAAGARIALDDFGTGYSSFAQLARFPFDKIKIDRQFTANMLENEKQTKIVRALIRLGAALEISMLAEGIETVAQCAKLREMGCYLGQGQLLGEPMPAEAVPGFLRQAGAAWARLGLPG